MKPGGPGRWGRPPSPAFPARSTHQHLPAWHEVGALADPLEDALQLGADEAVVLGDSEKPVREEATRYMKRCSNSSVINGFFCLKDYHFKKLQSKNLKL